MLPTPPGALPLIGHGHRLLFDPLAFMQECNELGPVVRLRGPGPDVHLVTAPELIHQIFVTDTRHYAKGRLTDSIGAQFGPSVVMDLDVDGLTLFEAHRRHRRAVQPGFHPHRIADHVHHVQQLTAELIAGWRPGQVVRADQQLSRLAYAATARAFCGPGPTTPPIAEALADLSPTVTMGLFWRIALPRLGRLRGVPGTGPFQRAHKRLRKAVIHALDAHRTEDRDHGDVLSHLIRARYNDTGEPLNDHQIVSETVFYLFAAVHAIADALPHALYEIARHPHIARHLRDEVDTVLAGEPVRTEHLPQLTYTRRLLLEVLRLHPPVWMLPRRTLAPVQVGDVALPAGSEIAVSPYAVHHHPGVHAEPSRFDPDRWLPEQARALPRAAHLAFGIGPRKCIGDHLAMTQLITALATITSHWTLHIQPGHRYRHKPRTFLYPGRMPLICHPTDTSFGAGRLR